MTVDKSPVEITPDCVNRGGVDNGVAAGQGVRWECCEKCSGPRNAANTRGPDSIRYERKGATSMVATTDTLRTLFRLAKFIDAKVTRNDGLLAALEGAFRSGDDAQLNAAALDILHAAEAVR